MGASRLAWRRYALTLEGSGAGRGLIVSEKRSESLGEAPPQDPFKAADTFSTFLDFLVAK